MKWPSDQGKKLRKLTAYMFFVQFALFVLFVALLPSNTELFESASTVNYSELLIGIHENSTVFIILKGLLLALRTLYAISFVALAILFLKKHTIAAPFSASFIIVSVAIINIAQLMGLALVPIAGDYVAAVAQGDEIRSSSLLAVAQGIYVIQEYLDTFVNTVTFIGLFFCLYAMFDKQKALQKVKWLIPVMVMMPFVKFFGLPEIVSLLSSLINVVVTAAFFFLIGRFLLQSDSRL